MPNEAPYNGKIRAIMIMCIFVSPLASLVRLGFLLHEKITQQLEFDVVPDASSSSSSSQQSLLVYLLNGSNSTGAIEEFVQNILSSKFNFGSEGNMKMMINLLTTNLHPNPLHILASISSMTVTSTSYNKDILESSPTLKMHVISHDLQLVLPFIFIFCFLLLGPMLIIFMRRFHEAGHGVYPGQRQNEAQRRMKKKKKKRKHRLLTCLEDYKMEITDSNFQKEESSNVSGEDKNSTREQSFSKAHELEDYQRPPNQHPAALSCPIQRISSNSTCAICLSNYDKGQTIVWSSNSNCIHIFHHDCMKQWIKKRADGDCPCCRRQFVDEVVYREAKMKFALKVD